MHTQQRASHDIFGPTMFAVVVIVTVTVVVVAM